MLRSGRSWRDRSTKTVAPLRRVIGMIGIGDRSHPEPVIGMAGIGIEEQADT
jgi:hypothetical protein